MRTIALEEHFWTAELAAPPGTGQLAAWGPEVGDRLRDLGPLRLADMDANGIDLQVISHVAPAAQEQAGAESLARAREANDQLAIAVRAHPDRFAGFATLPTADPQAAADELERAATQLGPVGALVNSTLGSNGAFLDDPRYEPLLDRFERLDVPLYLHPAPPPAALREVLYSGLPPDVAARLATGAWGLHRSGARGGPGAVQRRLPVRLQRGRPRPARRAAAQPRRGGQDRGRQRRTRPGPQADRGVIYVTSALPKVCARRTIYGTMLL